jgi:hypothetical protein
MIKIIFSIIFQPYLYNELVNLLLNFCETHKFNNKFLIFTKKKKKKKNLKNDRENDI